MATAESFRRYNFRGIFSLETNLPYFEGMFHAFKEPSETTNVANHIQNFHFVLDNKLDVPTKGKERVNLMFYHQPGNATIEFMYPWFKPICAKLEFKNDGFEFRFNKRYLHFSNIVAEGWELIDVFRSFLMIYLMARKMYMIHAAAVKIDRDGILFPAWGNTGKTTTSWMLAKNGANFLTDEFAILDAEGNCYGLPCSSLLSRGSVTRFGLQLSSMQKTRLLFSDLKSKIVSSRFAPGGLKVYPDELFATCDAAKITKLAIIQNGLDGMTRLNRYQARLRIKAIQDYEFNWSGNPYVLALSFFTGLDLDALYSLEHKFIEDFLQKIDSESLFLVSSTSGEHYKTILDQLVPKSPAHLRAIAENSRM